MYYTYWLSWNVCVISVFITYITEQNSVCILNVIALDESQQLTLAASSLYNVHY